jgi:hypothetical protein
VVSATLIPLMADPGDRTVLMCGSAAARLLALRVRIPPGYRWLCLVSVLCCEVEVSASG